MESYIAFFDLLGVKEIAKYAPLAYHDMIASMQQEIVDLVRRNYDTYRKQQVNINSYSDSVFVESKKLDVLFSFIKNLRATLYARGYYFNCAISDGSLDVVSTVDSLKKTEKKLDDGILDPSINLLYELRKYSEVLNSTNFLSRQVGYVYHLQTQMKGVGVYIDPKLKLPDTIKNNTAKLFFVPFEKKYDVLTYTDVKLTEYEVTRDMFETLCNRIFNANSKSKKYGKYYLSLLANFIYSSDFSKIRMDSESKEIVDAPYVYESLIMMKKSDFTKIKNTHGIEFIYIFLLNHLYNQQKIDISVTEYTMSMIVNKGILRRYKTHLEAIPSAILEQKNRSQFYNDYFTVNDIT